MIISTQRATLLLVGASTVLATAADNSFTPDHQSRARSLNAGPTTFELRRRLRHHQDVSNTRLHQKRLIQGLIPGLGGSDSQSTDGSTQSSSDTNQEGSSASTRSSSSPRPSSSSSSSSSGSKNNASNSSSNNRQSATSAATSASSSSNNSNNSNNNNNAASASSAAAAESQRQSSAAAAAAASSSQSAAAAAQASSLSQSAASAASANAASAASASVNSAVSGTQAAASSTPSAILITSSLPSGTTVITSIASLSPTGTADTYAGASGNGRSGAADGSQSGSSGDGKLSTAAIVGIVVPVAVIALIILVWTVVRKRQQAKSRALHPLDFTPAYGSGDSPQGVTRASQESWLGGGGRPMSGISDVEPEMMPPMEEMSHEDHLQRAGSYGGGFYTDGMALNVPPTAYSAATHGGAESRRLSAIQSVDTHNDQYYDGSAAAGYHNPAVRGTDVAGLERSGTGGSTSPYKDVARGYDGSSGGHGYGYDYRPDLDEPVRPQLSHGHGEAYGEDRDPFTYVPQHSAPAMTKSSSRWSG